MTGVLPVIGVDESGKGDFFGSLVIASLAAEPSQEKLLRSLGVRDSKAVANRKLLGIDEELRDRFEHVVLVLKPAEYNRRYEEIRNLNKLLAWCHAEVIDQLAQRCGAGRAISDKFGKPELIEDELQRRKQSIRLQQLVRGERIIQVAAASILARAAFLREMKRLSDKIGFDLPRGAGPPVDRAGRRIVAAMGKEILPEIAKTHFKNFQRVTQTSLFA